MTRDHCHATTAQLLHLLLYSLLLFLLSVCARLILLYGPHYVDISLVKSNQCCDVTHVGRIHRATIAMLYEFVKHDVLEVDPLLEGCCVLMLCIQILVSFASGYYSDKELVCP